MQHVWDAVAATNRPSRAVARVDPSVTRYQEDISKGVVIKIKVKKWLIPLNKVGKAFGQPYRTDKTTVDNINLLGHFLLNRP